MNRDPDPGEETENKDLVITVFRWFYAELEAAEPPLYSDAAKATTAAAMTAAYFSIQQKGKEAGI